MGAVESPIRESEAWFIGEDRSFVYAVTDSAGAPQTMTGWALTWELLTTRGGTVLLSKTTLSGISIGNGAGTDDYATVSIADIDTDTTMTAGPGTYWAELRRTDAGSEIVLAFGDAVLQKASI